MKIAWISTDANNKKRRDTGQYGGVGHYRIVQPMKHLTQHEHFFVNNVLPDDLNWVKDYDLVITKHASNPMAISRVFGACEYWGVPIVTDLDDDVFNVRPDQPAYKKGMQPGGEERAYMLSAISLSNAVFVTNEHLKKTVEDYMKEVFNVDMPVYILPNFFYPNEWGKSKKARYITIGWHGSITHNADIKSILPAIQKIIRKYKARFEFMGGLDHVSTKELFKVLPKEDRDYIFISGGTATWKNFPYHLLKQKWTIGICPLIDDQFNKCKSHIKWMEMTMKKIPVVASDVLPYKIIEHGKTGFLAKNNDEWVEYLSKLIEDEKLRNELAENAYNKITQDFTYKKNIHLWDKAIKSVLKSNKKTIKTL